MSILKKCNYKKYDVGRYKYFKIEINACKYWITDLIGECSCGAMKAEFVVRAIICAIVWSALAFVLGSIHFRKVDVK